MNEDAIRPRTRAEQIADYKNVNATFVDYTKFQDDETRRSVERDRFLRGEDYVPHYDYPKLEFLADDAKLTQKKASLYEATLALEAAKTENTISSAEASLYADYFELRLKKILLVEAARNLSDAYRSPDWATNTQSFMELNKEVFGEYDFSTFGAMTATEYARAMRFVPGNDKAVQVKDELMAYLEPLQLVAHEEERLPLGLEDLQEIHDLVMERYGDILAVVPDTDDDVYYDANECAAIMNKALEAGGLAALGWRAVVDGSKSNPATSGEKKTISLPSSTRRNASELRRLIIHEQEVHARRAENGKASGSKPLATGTADYADVEEGLGVLLECAVAGSWDNASFNRARDRYITTGLAIGLEGVVPARDARQVHDVLWRLMAIRNAMDGLVDEKAIESAKRAAYLHVENAFRGTSFWMRGTIYTKLKVYYEGFEKNAAYLAQHKDDLNEALDVAMIGKYDHTNAGEQQTVYELLGERS